MLKNWHRSKHSIKLDIKRILPLVSLLVLLLSLALVTLVGLRLYRTNTPAQKWRNHGLVIPGNDETYAKAIAQSYKLLVERYVIPISPKLLYKSAVETIALLEQHWLKGEQKITAEAAAQIAQWEQEARAGSAVSDEANNIRAPKRRDLSPEQKAEQQQLFATEYSEIKPELLRQKYVDALAKSRLQGFYSKEFAKKLYTEIMAALCRPLHDPFSGFFQESGFYQLSDTTNGSFGGVGLYITKQHNFALKNEAPAKPDSYQYLQRHFVKVSRPFPGGPSFRAGIMADDFIYAVDGQNAKDWSVEQVQNTVRGKPGSKVNITVLRARQHQINFTVVREQIEVRAVNSDTIDLDTGEQILYVELSQFNAAAGKQFKEQVQRQLQQDKNNNIAAVLLDLRNNPGGLLSVAVDIAEQFLPEGLIVATDARSSENILQFSAKKKVTIPAKLPVYAMINSESASAAEIVAGALQDNKRGQILGQKSFGKGSVQIPVTLPEGILKLTIAHFYTPKGVNLANNGIEPDYEFTVPTLSKEEQAALVKLLESSLISSFVSQNRNYSQSEFQALFAEEIKSNYQISQKTAERLAYNERRRYLENIPTYNLAYDDVLREAVTYISKRLAAK